MSDNERSPRATTDNQQLEERSLLGLAYSYGSQAKLGGQSMADLENDDSDD